MYEMRIWSRPPLHSEAEAAIVHGENGYVIIGNGVWRAYDEKGGQAAAGSGAKADDDVAHKRNMLNCIRDGGQPACDVAVGHVASSLVHMGNVSWRVDRKLHFDGGREEFIGDAEANKYLGRTYRRPWLLPEV